MLLEERSEIVRRLRVSEGHLHAIIGMLKTDQPYVQVIHQLRAVRAALKTASRCLLTHQIEQSREIILHSVNAEKQTAELAKLHELFAALAHSARFQGGPLAGRTTDDLDVG